MLVASVESDWKNSGESLLVNTHRKSSKLMLGAQSNWVRAASQWPRSVGAHGGISLGWSLETELPKLSPVIGSLGEVCGNRIENWQWQQTLLKRKVPDCIEACQRGDLRGSKLEGSREVRNTTMNCFNFKMPGKWLPPKEEKPKSIQVRVHLLVSVAKDCDLGGL